MYLELMYTRTNNMHHTTKNKRPLLKTNNKNNNLSNTENDKKQTQKLNTKLENKI